MKLKPIAVAVYTGLFVAALHLIWSLMVALLVFTFVVGFILGWVGTIFSVFCFIHDHSYKTEVKMYFPNLLRRLDQVMTNCK